MLTKDLVSFEQLGPGVFQGSVKICTFWLGPSLCAYRMIGYFRM